jgi:hypothetical protein
MCILCEFCPSCLRTCREGVEADVTTYNAVLLAEAMLAAEEPGQAQAAHGTFEEMRRRGLEPDALSYSALATAFANSGMEGRALQVGSVRAVTTRFGPRAAAGCALNPPGLLQFSCPYIPAPDH